MTETRVIPFKPWCVFRCGLLYKMGTQSECLRWMALKLNGMTVAAAYKSGFAIKKYDPQKARNNAIS